MRSIRPALIVLLLALGGCVTPLEPDNYPDRFDVTQLDTDQFRIEYSGWPSADDEMVTDLALLSSAETALQNGFHYFVVVDGDSAQEIGSADPPMPDAEYLEHNGMRYRVTAPGDANHIICFHDSNASSGYVALFVKASLRARYQLDRAGPSQP